MSVFIALLFVGTGSDLFFNFSREFVTFYFTEFHRTDLVYIASDNRSDCNCEHLIQVGRLLKVLHESAAVKTVSNLVHRRHSQSDADTARYFMHGDNVHILIPECTVKQPFEFYFSSHIFMRENVIMTSLTRETELNFPMATPKCFVMTIKAVTYFVTRNSDTTALSFSHFSRSWPDYAKFSVDMSEPVDAIAKLRILKKSFGTFAAGERITVSCSIEHQKMEEMQILKSIIRTLNVSTVLSFDSTYGGDILMTLMSANEDIYLHYFTESHFQNVDLQAVPLFVGRHDKIFHPLPALEHELWAQLQAFDIYTWIFIFLSLGIVTVLLTPWTCARDYAVNLVSMFGVMIGRNTASFRNRGMSLFVIWILACIVLGTVYQSRLISIMTSPSRKMVYVDRTWNRMFVRKLPVCFSRYSRITGDDALDAGVAVKTYDIVRRSAEECMHMVWNGTHAFIGSEEVVSAILSPGFAPHLVLDIGRSSAFFFAVRPKFVHKQRIIRAFKTSFETGLSNAQRQRITREGEIRQRYYLKLPVDPSPIGFGTLRGVFWVYLIGSALSLFCLLLEMHL